MTDLVLASSSPRRAELLRQVGLAFDVVSPAVDERERPGESGTAMVRRLAAAKAAAVVATLTPGQAGLPVLAADTVVTCPHKTVASQRILGKPGSRDEGIEMLLTLSNRVHVVLTGVAVAGTGDGAGRVATCVVATNVHFRHIDPTEAEDYWLSGEPGDKAGGYGAQGLGALFIDRIEGSYSNVVGLPLTETVDLLRAVGVDPLHLAAQRSAGD